MPFKRILSVMCGFSLTLSLLPITAFGAESAGEGAPPIIEEESSTVDAIETPLEVDTMQNGMTDIIAPNAEDDIAAEPPETEIESLELTEQAIEAPLGNGPANSWRFDNGELIDPDSMLTDSTSEASIAAVRDGMYTTFETFNRGYCTGSGAARGVDVSKWQGYIDWARVKAAGVDFAIIRCGYGDNLAQQDDEYFLNNVRGCLQNGIPFGIYLYSYATNTGSGNAGALSEANHVLRCMRNAGLSPSQVALPVYLDMEDNSTLGANLYSVANTFCNTIQNAGYTPGVYASTSWWSNHLTNSGFGRWSRWIAQYNTGRGVEYPFRSSSDVWQFSSRGSIAGIPGNADLNYTYLPQAYSRVRANMNDYKLVFNYAAYKKYNPTLSFSSESAAFQHFISSGMASGLRASEVFDPAYYKDAYADVRNAYGNDWVKYYDHFRKYGAKEARQASSNFSPLSYYYAYPDLRAAFGVNPASYFEHYNTYGYKEGRQAIGCTSLQGSVTTKSGVNYAPVYDYAYYTANNADVTNACTKKFGGTTVINDAAVLDHFIKYGMKEGRQGNAAFDYLSYYYANPDLRAAFGLNIPSYYTHYIKYGQKEGRVTANVPAPQGNMAKLSKKDYSPIYDSSYYIANNPDVARAYTKKFGKTSVVDETATLKHFVNYGMKEGRSSSPNFDYLSYYYRYPDLRAAFGTNVASYYKHYLNYGAREKRIATGTTQLIGSVTTQGRKDYSAVYDYAYYVNNNPDVARAYTKKLGTHSVIDQAAVLNHFIKYGMKEGRASSPDFSWTTYRDRYADLREAFGDNPAAYYIHYMTYGKKEGRIAA